MNYNEALEKLNKIEQAHLLKFYDELNDDERKELLNSIEQMDFSVLTNEKGHDDSKVISPIKTLSLEEIKEESGDDKALGLKALNEGKLACLLLAGGMGSRLGYDHPKGMYNIGQTKELSIFECQMNNLKSVSNECGSDIYLFIMTSPLNDSETRGFFETNNYFGYNKEFIKFFIQDEAPITDTNGKILMTSKSKPASAANGNGGWYSSMKRAGLVEFARQKGIEYINIYSVDNVLQKMADPVFLGATLKRNVEVSAKVVRKADPKEKVGVICLEDNHPSIVEYTDLSDELRYAKDNDGNYLYYFGVILNYIFKLDSLDRTLNEELPLHKAFKAFSHIDDNGIFIKEEKPNAYKFETLVVDMIRMMSSCLSFEVEREKEFAPVKNLSGVDSVDSARELLIKNNIEI